MIDIVNNPAQLPFFETVLFIILSVAAVMAALFGAVAFQDKQRVKEDYWKERGFGYYNPKIGMLSYNAHQVSYTNGIGVLQLVCIAILVIFLIVFLGGA